MALTGIHVTCGFAGAQYDRSEGMALLGKLAWAQTMAAPGTTTQVAPVYSDQSGDPMFQVRSAVDCFVAIGPAPDASTITSKRIFVPAGERVEFYGEPGDRLAWVAA